MLRTGRVILLLSLLSVLILGRAGLSVWTSQQSADEVIGMAQAATNRTQEKPPANASAQNQDQNQNKQSLMAQAIPEAEALPYTPDDVAISQAERETLLSLRKTRDELIARQKALDERQQAAEDGEKKLAERIGDLEELESRIKDMLNQEKSINTKKIKRLTAVYEGMKANRAAPVISRMDLPTVVRMFSRMDEKQVGKILSFLQPEQAVKISQALTDRISEIQ